MIDKIVKSAVTADANEATTQPDTTACPLDNIDNADGIIHGEAANANSSTIVLSNDVFAPGDGPALCAPHGESTAHTVANSADGSVTTGATIMADDVTSTLDLVDGTTTDGSIAADDATRLTEVPPVSPIAESADAPWVGVPAETHTAPATVAAEMTEAKPTRRKRGTNPAGDTNCARLYVLGVLAVIADGFLGGLEQAVEAHRKAAGVHLQKQFPKIKDAKNVLRERCQWALREAVLNCEGASDFKKYGLEKYYDHWAANRLYYFYRTDDRCEHPRCRKKGNLCAIYRELYEHFHVRLQNSTPITEDEAKTFMMSVSDRVPFQWPVEAQAPTSASSGTNDPADNSSSTFPQTQTTNN